MGIERRTQTAVVNRFSIVSSLCYCTFFVLLIDCTQYARGQVQPVPRQEEQPPPAQATAPWYETLPAVAMDYKVIIDPGKEDCYFQFVNPGATFYASAQVHIYLSLCI